MRLTAGKNFFASLGYASDVQIQADKTGIADDAVSAVIGRCSNVHSSGRACGYRKGDRASGERREETAGRAGPCQRYAEQREVHLQGSGSQDRGREGQAGEVYADDGAGTGETESAPLDRITERLDEDDEKAGIVECKRPPGLRRQEFHGFLPGSGCRRICHTGE